MSFHWSAENKSWPELLHWSVGDFLTAQMSSTLSGQWLWIPVMNSWQCSVTPRNSDATVSTTEHSSLHSCWWMGIVLFSRSIRLLHFGYPAGFGVLRPTTSICRSIGAHRSSQKQMEGDRHWDSSKIHCTIEKTRLNAVRRQNGCAIQHNFR